MEYLMIYVIFVITTISVVLYSILLPVVKEVFATMPPPLITRNRGNKTLLILALSLGTALVAPLMFFIWLSPRWSNQFREVLAADLKKS